MEPAKVAGRPWRFGGEVKEGGRGKGAVTLGNFARTNLTSVALFITTSNKRYQCGYTIVKKA